MLSVSAYQTFSDRWGGAGVKPIPVPVKELERIESELGVLFPYAYLLAMTEVGPLHLPTLLDAIVESDMDIYDVQEFLHPNQIETALGWRDAGLPLNLLPIAMDCMGNLFCFNMMELGIERSHDAPIWYFDHDPIEVGRISQSFEHWIAGYSAVPPAFGNR